MCQYQMRSLIKKIIFNRTAAKPITRFLAKVHHFIYSYLGFFASASEGGIHPKHRIMKYKEWFLDNIKTDWIVLDVGCSTGLMTELLAQKASFVYGVEINESLVKEARKKTQRHNIEYVCADATTYDFTGKTIDCIALSNVLEHIEDRIGFLKKLVKNPFWRVEERWFLIRVPMINRDWLTLYKKELGLEYRLDPTHYIEYTFEQFQEELREASIEIISHHVRFGEIYAVCRTRIL